MIITGMNGNVLALLLNSDIENLSCPLWGTLVWIIIENF